MMKQQSPEFILGYLFSQAERKILKDVIPTTKPIFNPPNFVRVQVPLLWFGIKQPNYCNSTQRATAAAIADEIAHKLDSTLEDVFIKRHFSTVVVEDKQYLSFVTTVKEERRKLTVSQIEDLLGYKVTIVSEDN